MSTLPPYFLFRFQFEAKNFPQRVTKITPEILGPDYDIPFHRHFPAAAGLRSRRDASGGDSSFDGGGSPDFHFRFAWREDGLLLTAILCGKKKAVQAAPSKLETSDALRLLFDTRDVRDVHRATKYCHRLLFLPTDSPSPNAPGRPQAFWLPIHRAKAHPNPIDASKFLLASDIREDGWSLSAFIPGETLTGYAPKEHSRTGFWFSLFDNEFGWFNLQHPNFFPVEEDPSLWSPLDLV